MCDGSEHKSVTWTSKKIKISVQTTHACHLGLMHWLEIGGGGKLALGLTGSQRLPLPTFHH